MGTMTSERNDTPGRRHLTRTLVALVAMITLVGSTTIVVGGAQPAPASELASAQPRTDIPVVLDGEVSSVARAGNTVFIAGTFTQLRDAGDTTVVTQPHLAAYDATTGALLTGFDPVIDKEVQALAVSTDGGTLYVGGQFSNIDGQKRRKLAALDAATGELDPDFVFNTNSRVTALAVGGDHLYVGGKFTVIGGQSHTRLAAIDLTAGTVDPNFNIDIEQGTGYNGGSAIKALEVSPDGSTLLSVHNDRLVGGQVRTGVALIDISGPVAAVKPWYTDLYDLNRCNGADNTLVRDGTFSPDGSYLVIVSSGDDYPPACNTAVAFPVVGTGRVDPLWVSRHFDTVAAVAITWNAVYVGGHFFYEEAPGSDEPWPGVGQKFADGDARQLGDQVVLHRRLGALNPEDGKALDWSPHTNGDRGILALDAVGGELLMGHDGDEITGQTLGRHGSFALPPMPPGADYVRPAGLPGPPVTTTTTTTVPPTPTTVAGTAPGRGYWLLEADGQVHPFGAAAALTAAPAPAVDMAVSPDGESAWILDTSGRVYARGSAIWYGNVDLNTLSPGERVSAISARPSGDGYWVFTDRGRALNFGAAPDFGDVSNLTLRGPVIASVATVSGNGYWMVGDDGGVFAFGDAEFHGSTGAMTLDQPVVGLAPDPDGDGYWLVAADGGAFAFDAPFRGSLPGILNGTPLARPIVGMVAYGDGYVMLGADGGTFSFSDKPFLGSLGANPPDSDVVAIAAF